MMPQRDRDKELQRRRNAIGQLTKANTDLVEQRRQMQADLIRQRADMAEAIAAIDRGEIRTAREVLQDAIDYRMRTRQPRKTAGGAA